MGRIDSAYLKSIYRALEIIPGNVKTDGNPQLARVPEKKAKENPHKADIDKTQKAEITVGGMCDAKQQRRQDQGQPARSGLPHGIHGISPEKDFLAKSH